MQCNDDDNNNDNEIDNDNDGHNVPHLYFVFNVQQFVDS